MDLSLLLLIKSLRQQRRDSQIVPDYVPFNDLYATSTDKDSLRKRLNDAYRDGFIKVHEGLNQKLIELIKDNFL